ncbi:unnamed protein product [Heterobilharzia americana]|nr:unnamed protein product [Heterobilharzia americana]
MLKRKIPHVFWKMLPYIFVVSRSLRLCQAAGQTIRFGVNLQTKGVIVAMWCTDWTFKSGYQVNSIWFTSNWDTRQWHS